MDDENKAAADAVVLFGQPDEDTQFRLTVTEKTRASISGHVDEVIAWDAEKQPVDFCLYLTFHMKWDGCCNVTFGEREDGKQDGCLHLCGAGSWESHIRLMTQLYQWAETAIPMNRDESGEFSPNTALNSSPTK